jgi:hypothetical protein
MNGYQLTRRWFDFAFDNKEVKPQHTALYCWCVELNNRLQWKKSFGLPTDESCEYTGIGNRKTFYNALDDLKKWGFVEIIQDSKNQNQSRVISLCLCENEQAPTQAPTQAGHKQSESNDSGSAPIGKQYKPKNSKTIKTNVDFDFSLYGSFSNLIERWAKYRKAENKPIKSQDSLDTFSKRLNMLSDGDFQKAEAIIEQAIANGWQGIFELKGTLNVGSNNSQLPVDASQIVNYGKGNGKVFFDKKAGLWYEPLTNGYLPKEISDYYYYDQGNHSNYGDYVRWMIENNKNPLPPEDTRYFPEDWNFEKFVSEQRAIVASSNL